MRSRGAHRGAGEMGRDDPSSPPSWFLNQKHTEGLGGTGTSEDSIMERRVRDPESEMNQQVLAGEAGVSAWPLHLIPHLCQREPGKQLALPHDHWAGRFQYRNRCDVWSTWPDSQKVPGSCQVKSFFNE